MSDQPKIRKIEVKEKSFWTKEEAETYIEKWIASNPEVHLPTNLCPMLVECEELPDYFEDVSVNAFESDRRYLRAGIPAHWEVRWVLL